MVRVVSIRSREGVKGKFLENCLPLVVAATGYTEWTEEPHYHLSAAESVYNDYAHNFEEVEDVVDRMISLSAAHQSSINTADTSDTKNLLKLHYQQEMDRLKRKLRRLFAKKALATSTPVADESTAGMDCGGLLVNTAAAAIILNFLGKFLVCFIMMRLMRRSYSQAALRQQAYSDRPWNVQEASPSADGVGTRRVYLLYNTMQVPDQYSQAY